jgi:hypothetical protein
LKNRAFFEHLRAVNEFPALSSFSYPSAGNHGIGFVFLCPRRADIYHNLLSNKTMRRFAQTQIGFVFSFIAEIAKIAEK